MAARKAKSIVADPKDRNTHISAPRSKYSYVAFPLNEKDSVTEPFKFTIELSFPDTIIFNGKQRDLRPEIEAALWAWETFGGIGARTRRGFGALQWLNPDDEACSPDATKKTVEDWLNKQLECHVVTGTWPDYVPHLPRACNADWIRVVTLDQKQSAQDVWVHLFTKLKNFRQLRFGRFGRSKWPEPEAIREITGQRLPKHQKMTPLIKKFPRAAFGLPIIFQFKDNDKRNSGRLNQDPKQTSLESILSDRFASPLILRPLILRGNQKAGIAIILAGTAVPLVDLKLKGAPSNQERVSGSLDPKTKEAKQIEALNGETDVLRAFLDSLR